MADYNSQPKPLVADGAASIDRNYGPWESTGVFELWYLTDEIMAESIPEGLTIAVKSEDGTIIKYVREKGTWKTEGGSTGGSTVSVTQKITSDTEVAKITVDGTETTIYAPTPTEGGGSSADVINNLNPDSTTSVLSAA